MVPGEEQARILPVIEAVLKEKPGTVLSVDTFHASTARLAIEAGAEIVNDVSGHTWDPAMATTCASKPRRCQSTSSPRSATPGKPSCRRSRPSTIPPNWAASCRATRASVSTCGR